MRDNIRDDQRIETNVIRLFRTQKEMADTRRASNVDQASADLDQSAADADQTHSDDDQTGSRLEQASADRDQRASDHDQAASDRDRATHDTSSAEDTSAYNRSRRERQAGSIERSASRSRRELSSRDRDFSSGNRDRAADVRDETSRSRGRVAPALPSTERAASLRKQLDELRQKAASDRARAAEDRARAAHERSLAAREMARLQAALQSAHLDELTGAYRREMGRLALSNEIDRARRLDGRFVLAFVDVDRLKAINDRDGHAAGDRVLQMVVQAMRRRLRSFDPIVRYGGDEFVCGLGGTDLLDAVRRFDLIGTAIEADAGVGISVGLAPLGPGDTPELLTERADAAMLEIKAIHHLAG